MKIKKCIKNALNLVYKTHKIQTILQKAYANCKTYAWKIFWIKLKFLECLDIILSMIIVIRAYFQNFGLFLVWSANYGPFCYMDCVIYPESNPSSKIIAIIGSKPHYDYIWCNGSKVWIKKCWKSKKSSKTPQSWSVKYIFQW